MSERPSYTKLLRNRSFGSLWLAQLISQSGDAVFDVALLWLVLVTTGSAALVGVTQAAVLLPAVLASPIAGVYADRLNRRNLMLASNLVQGGLYLSVQDGQGRTTGVDSRSNTTVAAIPGSYYATIGHVMAVVLPGNVTSFSYQVDGSRASQNIENYTLALEATSASGFAAQKVLSSSVGKGTSATYGVVIASGAIANVHLYAVSLIAIDDLGLPASGAAATLTSAGGQNATITSGSTVLLPGGRYSLRMDYLGQSVHQSVEIAQSGSIAVRITLSVYGVVLIVAVTATLVGAAFFIWKRRGPGRAAARVSEWLR